MKTSLLLFTLMISNWLLSQDQNYSISFITNKIEYTVEEKKDSVIPIDIEVVNTTSSFWENDWVSIDVLENGLTSVLQNNYSLSKNKLPLKSLDNNKTIFVRINDESLIKNDDKILLQLNVKNNITERNRNDLNVGKHKIIQIIFKSNNTEPSNGKTISLKEYFHPKKEFKLEEIINVESKDNILTVSGYDYDEKFKKRNIILERHEIFAVGKFSIPLFKKLEPLPLSLITIPFKVRPKIKIDDVDKKSYSSSGVTNIGFNMDLAKYQIDRYFSNGKKGSHKLSIGFWGAPAVEELDSLSTKGVIKETSKQLFISTGFTISYSYNDISFVFVPAGWDFGTSSIGKSWVYNKKRWWGFGIAISPKIFATILNK